MLKRSIPFLAITIILPLLAMGQEATEWQFERHVPSDTSVANTHGLTFDGEDKLWTGGYYQTTDEDGNPARALECFEADLETPCDFSPVYGVEHADSTLRFGMITGVASDPNGDVLITMHGNIYEADDDFTLDVATSFIVRIDHQTGEGLDVAEITDMRDDDNSHAHQLAADENGYIYYSAVFGGAPIHIVDENFNEVGQATANREDFARDIAVNADGSKIYQPTDGPTIQVYEGDPFGGYELADTTTFADMDPGAVSVCPATGMLHASASGSGWDPLNDPEVWNTNSIYSFDPTAGYAVSDEVSWDFGDGDEEFHPLRGLAISSDGQTMVAGSFGGQGLQKFTRDELPEPTAGEEFRAETPEGYVLEQNYPNPFNPDTQIRFEIPESGMATLKVYDMLGREVTTLVNEHMDAGQHQVTFDATGLASGTYIYRLEVGGVELTRQMSFIK
ncbi:T9SS type A sorting domain-containing protein [Natronogracilivirga saccharolytica]|uniref:T9SS type A sorting domain-containing protein n=1 Tax=Natronogracilivirga saccharolytica TaxID=2812953 RepID=A0A8J7UUL3_9BACT|nr:T9SS type A sorting domain-containing protein [Natronogracilivirga saccharolytica]MBP3193746.1 T9SS type A sorting domain-containing protein [Natronogracilivirga saccharolytica]